MTTIRDVVSLARFPLNDNDPLEANLRVGNDELARYVVTGLMQAFRTRGDLFVGSFMNPPTLSMGLDSTFPLDDTYVQVLADYATARAEAADDESASEGRASAFYQIFGKVVP